MKLLSLYAGLPKTNEWQGREITTALVKEKLSGPAFLGRTNLEGDRQADLVHHGGLDKAVCVYPYEHYSYWEQELETRLPEAAFGENFSVMDMKESAVHVGDVFQVGEAVVQISQPREPCYKPAARLGIKELPHLIRQTGYSGYYVRVLKEGTVKPGDFLKLLKAGEKQITIAEANRIMYYDTRNAEKTAELLQEEALADAWRIPLEKRAAILKEEKGFKE
ncbi:MAG: MOSC domain-containing protein [Alkalicoccus sp.]|nr:MAG: MOSC domain-containing protein [Alkalicoccus sp.]